MNGIRQPERATQNRVIAMLYVKGIAMGVIELKNSRVSIGDGIRQLISNQSAEFNEWFFSTVQIVFAGNDSEGLQYGTIKTEEKYFLKWKEDEADNSRFKLDKYLLKMCNKQRLVELMSRFRAVRRRRVLEPTHNQRFIALMDHFMPKWKFFKDQLNRLPVRHEDWGY